VALGEVVAGDLGEAGGCSGRGEGADGAGALGREALHGLNGASCARVLGPGDEAGDGQGVPVGEVGEGEDSLEVVVEEGLGIGAGREVEVLGGGAGRRIDGVCVGDHARG
jgi:hypothetical protein